MLNNHNKNKQIFEINCDKISFSYSKKIPAIFKDLSFKYSRPGFHALFGESGVGKSSLAKILAGYIVPNKGRIVYQGITNVIYTTNQERFPGWQSVEKHFDSVLPKEKHNLWRKMMTDFGISNLMQSRFSQLSLGQQNRVNLIRYLFQDDPVLIMDESLANVDENMREKIILLIKKQFPDKCFIYISHHVREVCKFCDQIIVLRSQNKEPQVLIFKGQNCMGDSIMDVASFEQKMMEIVNAS